MSEPIATKTEVEEAFARLRSAQDMKQEAEVDRVAELATQAFFATVAAALPAGTPGDFPPDAHVAFEQAAQSAVRTMLLNVR